MCIRDRAHRHLHRAHPGQLGHHERVHELAHRIGGHRHHRHRQHLGQGHGQDPVSYTHLDVYKRQAVGNTVAECQKAYQALLATNGVLADSNVDTGSLEAQGTICLLYTSRCV